MGSRGRQSAADLSSVANTAQALMTRPKPWPGLTERENQLWKQIVNSQAVDWFGPADQPILMAYVRTVALHERVSLESFGAPLLIVGAAGTQIANPIFGIQNKAALAMASLATKLRLTQSTRMSDHAARSKGKKNASTQGNDKPWSKAA